MDFFNTFRGRLLVILTVLLMATLGVQFYLNLRTQNENERLREMQEQTIVAGIALGFNSITSSEYMQDLIDKPDQTFLDEKARDRIRDIIIINNKWQVTDSLNPDLVPSVNDDGTTTLVPVDPGVSRFDFLVADEGSERRLLLRDPQHEHVFNEAGPRKAPTSR